MTRFKAILPALILPALAAGCSSKSPPAEYDYGDPALVVEGTEVWQALHWGGRGPFEKLDADGDGSLAPSEFTAKVRRAEASQRALAIFGILDADRNEQLSWEEYRRKPPRAILVNLDADGDGALSAGEFAAGNQSDARLGRIDEVFAAWDRDGDGRLTDEELALPPVEHGFHQRDDDGDRLISVDEFVPPNAIGEEAQRRRQEFRGRDVDLDGTLTFRELFFEEREARFWALDLDGDGTVDRDEFMRSKGIGQIRDPEAAFGSVDRNSDGRIGLGEFRDRSDQAAAVLGPRLPEFPDGMAAMFSQLDADRDGTLPMAEILADRADPSVEALAKSTFDAADLDGDGRLVRKEFARRSKRFRFFLADVDSSGLVSVAELQAADLPWASDARTAEIFASADADTDGGLDFEEYGNVSDVAGLLLHDWDENGRVSHEEFACGHASYVADGRFPALFEAYDRDGSGDLSATEQEQPPVVLQFFEKDRNADRVLSFEEFCSAADDAEQVEAEREKFSQRDKDGSDGLSIREYFCFGANRQFWEMDLDGDDTVSPQEFRDSERLAHLSVIADAIHAAIDGNKDGRITLSEYRSRPASVQFTECDVDMDGRLTPEEFAKAASGSAEDRQVAFTALDANTDGALAREEFAAEP